MKRHSIALWDVLYKAEREGSLDSNILNEEFNNIASLIAENPSIEIIVTNGGKAAKAFKKYLRTNPRPVELDAVSTAVRNYYEKNGQKKPGPRLLASMPTLSSILLSLNLQTEIFQQKGSNATLPRTSCT